MKRERLYLLKGHIGLVGDGSMCQVSFCLPYNERLAYLNLAFSKEELRKNSPEQFIKLLKTKVNHLEMSWKDHVRELDKKGNAT